MQINVSNSIRKFKLKYNDIWELILDEKLHKKGSSEGSCFNIAFNIDT